MTTDQQELLTRFQSLVEAHDLTYQYSDDYHVWAQGESEYQTIFSLYREIQNKREAIRIWNDNVKKKVKDPAQFLWSDLT